MSPDLSCLPVRIARQPSGETAKHAPLAAEPRNRQERVRQLPVSEGAACGHHHLILATSSRASVSSKPKPTRFVTTQRAPNSVSGQRCGPAAWASPFAAKFPSAATSLTSSAPQARLIIEVDGGVHLHRAHLDAHRDSILQRAGYRVRRIPAALVTSPRGSHHPHPRSARHLKPRPANGSCRAA